MKKIKVLSSIFATGLATVAAPLSLASCNTKDKDTGIEIETHENITVECSSITKGKDLTITFALKDGYGFDVANSTITFNDTNTTISLLECKIEGTTITVPGDLVTSTNVKIDIKAENNASAEVNEEQFNAALDALESYKEERQFFINGPGLVQQYDVTGKLISSIVARFNYAADGLRDHFWETADGYEQTILEYWSAPDTLVGCWQTAKTPEMEIPSKAPATRSFGSGFMSMVFHYMFPGYSAFTFNSLYNAYVGENVPAPQENVKVALKFDNNHKLIWIGYVSESKESSSQSLTKVTTSWDVDYSKPAEFTIPEGQIIDQRMYDKNDEYTWNETSQKLECPLHQDFIEGRLVIPTAKIEDFSNEKKLIVKLDQSVSAEWVEAAVGLRTKTVPYTWDPTTYTLTIPSSSLKEETVDTITVVLSNPGIGGSGSLSKATKFIIYQEAE